MWNIYTMEYYSKERMPFAATWMDLESVILREVSEEKYWVIFFTCGI